MHARCAIISAAAAMAIASAASAAFQETICFDEVSSGTLANGLTIKNVGFSIQDIAGRANAALGPGPGATPYVSAPMLEGPTLGTLGLRFAQPVTTFGFGFALSVGGAVPAAVAVDVFDPQGAFLATVIADGKPGNRGVSFYSSNQLTLLGLGPIGSASLNFADYLPLGDGPSQGIPIVRFAIDNLGYTIAAIPVPLPTTGLLGAAGLLCLSVRRRRGM